LRASKHFRYSSFCATRFSGGKLSPGASIREQDVSGPSGVTEGVAIKLSIGAPMTVKDVLIANIIRTIKIIPTIKNASMARE
jgi:hypothetical protein